MNYTVFFLTVFLSLGAVAHAQDLDQGVDDRVAKMTKELNLTDSQAEAIRPVVKDYFEKCTDVAQQFEAEPIIDHRGERHALAALRDDEYQKLGKILTKDQMELWTQKEAFRASLNQGGTKTDVDDGTTLTPEGANFKF